MKKNKPEKAAQVELDREQLQTALLENSEIYDLLLDSARDMILIHGISPDGNPSPFLKVNNAACERLGYSNEEMKHLTPLDIISEKDFESVSDEARQLLDNRQLLFEKTLVAKSGKRIPVEINTRIYEKDVRKFAVSIARDITERKRIEDALKESEKIYKILTDSSLTGVFIIQDFKLVFVNDRYAEMAGYTPEELIGKGHVHVIHPDQKEKVRQRAQKRLNGESVPNRYEIKKLTKDGETFWVETIVSDPIEYRGQPAIMGHEIDITHRKQTEKALRENEERLRRVVENMPDDDECIR